MVQKETSFLFGANIFNSEIWLLLVFALVDLVVCQQDYTKTSHTKVELPTEAYRKSCH